MLHLAHGQGTAVTPRPDARRGAWPLALRLRVWAGSMRLDLRLAEGVRPARSPELTLRAQQLASARVRHQLAGALTAAVDAARRPRRPITTKAPLVAPAAERGAHDLAGLELACGVEQVGGQHVDAELRALRLVGLVHVQRVRIAGVQAPLDAVQAGGEHGGRP